MTKDLRDQIQQAVSTAIDNCIRNDSSFGSYASFATKAVFKVLERQNVDAVHADALKDMISELEARCAKWEAVFGHLGDTPDECGNVIIAARDELENRCAELAADKGTWYRMSEVFSKRITEVEESLKASEARCAVLIDALHQISLCSQMILSSQRECGRIARLALEKSK